MVFESVVADLINRYLGDFIENLDHSQLKLGLWGGKLQLTNPLMRRLLELEVLLFSILILLTKLNAGISSMFCRHFFIYARELSFGVS